MNNLNRLSRLSELANCLYWFDDLCLCCLSIKLQYESVIICNLLSSSSFPSFSSGCGPTAAVVSTSAARVAPATGATVSRLRASSTVVKSGAKVEKPHQVDSSIVVDVVQ